MDIIIRCKCESCGRVYPIKSSAETTYEAIQKVMRDKYYSFTECLECKESRILKKYRNRQISYEECAEQLGFCTLIGTPKQIHWAEYLRVERYREIKKEIRKNKEDIERIENDIDGSGSENSPEMMDQLKS